MNNIGWCDKTLNPIAGCTKVSLACDNCYAERFAFRHKKNFEKTGNRSLEKYSSVVDENGKWNGKTSKIDKTVLTRKKLGKKGNKIFLGSMTDIFHVSISDADRDYIMEFIKSNPDYIFQILTKRPEIMQKYLTEYYGILDIMPLNNLWIGITVENQQFLNDRILYLLNSPSIIRFISIEPSLGSIDLYPWLYECIGPSESMHNDWLNGLNWIIIGPETGPKARQMKKEWAQSIYDQCKEENVPLFDKKNILSLNLKQFPNVG